MLRTAESGSWLANGFLNGADLLRAALYGSKRSLWYGNSRFGNAFLLRTTRHGGSKRATFSRIAMDEWIHSVINSDQTGIIALIAVFLLGVISIFTCVCNVPILSALAGYSSALGASGKSKAVVAGCLFFLLGNVLSMAAIGCLVGLAGEVVGAAMGNYWKIGAGVFLIFFGVYILDILPFRIPGITFNFQNNKGGMAGCVLFGFVIGAILPLSTICCNPVFPIIIAASLVKGSMLWGLSLLLSFALGHGIILTAGMLGVGLGVGRIAIWLSKFAVVIKYAGGITLIVLGFYFLLTI
jgi:cytochrome c biogenesis protein CcdA